MRQQRWEYQVRYRRVGWKSSQVRYYQSKPFADRFVKKLHGYDSRWDGLEHLEWVKFERRRVGPWEEML